MLLYIVLFATAAYATSPICNIPQRQVTTTPATRLALPNPTVNRLLKLLLRDYNCRTSYKAPIWAAYEIVQALRVGRALEVTFRMAETVCVKDIPNHVRCPVIGGARKVQCTVRVVETVSADEMRCRALDATLLKQQAYKFVHFEQKRWWVQHTKTVIKVHHESSSMVEQRTELNRTALALLVVLTLNREQCISNQLVNYFGRTKLTSTNDAYEAVVYVAETECGKPRDISKIPRNVECAFVYPGKTYACLATISKPDNRLHDVVRCGPTDKVPENRLLRTPHESRIIH
uniref:Cystatin domain-containing protein n=1 Tax=Trichuris muris TaxID=70415 RepID=A0A5S6R577_TRIMR